MPTVPVEVRVHWWDGGWHMGWMVLWWGVALAVLALVIVAVVRAAQPRPEGPDRARHELEETPEDVLRRRFARGEIDEETFRRMRDELRR